MTDTTAEASTSTTNAGDQTTTDDQTVDTKAPDATTTETAQAVPEVYELKMPDGVALDQEAATEFTAIAKELKLDQATAQKFADVGAKTAQR